MSAQVTLRGRLVRDPELMFASSGKAVARFSIATSDRVKNRDTGEWEDANTSFWEVSAFGDLAENICESMQRGMGVVVVGKCKQEKYTTKQGEEKTAWKVVADDAAPSLRFAQAAVSAKGSKSSGAPAQRPSRDEPPF